MFAPYWHELLALPALAAAFCTCTRSTHPSEPDAGEIARTPLAPTTHVEAEPPLISLSYLSLYPWPPASLTIKEDHGNKAAAPPTIELDDTFLFELGIGDERYGLDLTVIAADGACTEVFRKDQGSTHNPEPPWRLAHFKLDQPDLERLVAVLKDNKFLTLPRGYDGGVFDGTEWIVHVRTRGRDKYVRADNAFPPPLVNIVRFVAQNIVNVRSADLHAQSRPERYGLYYGRDLWLLAQGEVDRLTLMAQATFSDPWPTGARFDAVVVSSNGKVLSSLQSDKPEMKVNYFLKDVDVAQRYVLRVNAHVGSKVIASSKDIPVLTFGSPRVVEVPLEPVVGKP